MNTKLETQDGTTVSVNLRPRAVEELPASYSFELNQHPVIEDVLADKSSSYFLKSRLIDCLERDPVDVVKDLEILYACMSDRLARLMLLNFRNGDKS